MPQCRNVSLEPGEDCREPGEEEAEACHKAKLYEGEGCGFGESIEDGLRRGVC